MILLFTNDGFAESIEVTDLSNPRELKTSWKNILDMANLLNEEEKDRIQNRLNDLNSNTGAEIAVVLLESIGEKNAKSFAVDLFKHWGIGRKGIDDGLLFLLVLDQRKWLFETGYGLEGVLPDVTLKRMGEKHLVPNLKKNNPGEGIYLTLEKLSDLIEKDFKAKENDSGTNEKSNGNLHGMNEDESEDFQEGESSFLSILATIGFIIYGLVLLGIVFLWLGHFVQIEEKDMNVEARINLMKSQWMNPWMIATLILFFPAIPLVLIVFYFMLKEIKGFRKKCPNCGENTYEKLSPAMFQSHLTDVERKELELNRIKIEIWECSYCGECKKKSERIHVDKNMICPNCKNYTKDQKFLKTVSKPSYSEKGIDLYEEFCHHCNYKNRIEISTPILKEQVKDNSSKHNEHIKEGDSYSWNHTNSSSDEDSSYDSSSDSDSDWGGGSSGGGGASGSW